MDIAASLMDNRIPAGQHWGIHRQLKPAIVALRKSLLPDPFEGAEVCLEQKLQSWIRVLCAVGHGGAKHRGLLQLLSLSPAHPVQWERE